MGCGRMRVEWISVKDRLPEDKSYWDPYLVIVQTHGGLLPDGCYRHIDLATFMPAGEPNEKEFDQGNTAYWEFDGREQNIPFFVSHWMPLPKLPELVRYGL